MALDREIEHAGGGVGVGGAVGVGVGGGVGVGVGELAATVVAGELPVGDWPPQPTSTPKKMTVGTRSPRLCRPSSVMFAPCDAEDTGGRPAR